MSVLLEPEDDGPTTSPHSVGVPGSALFPHRPSYETEVAALFHRGATPLDREGVGLFARRSFPASVLIFTDEDLLEKFLLKSSSEKITAGADVRPVGPPRSAGDNSPPRSSEERELLEDATLVAGWWLHFLTSAQRRCLLSGLKKTTNAQERQEQQELRVSLEELRQKPIEEWRLFETVMDGRCLVPLEDAGDGKSRSEYDREFPPLRPTRAFITGGFYKNTAERWRPPTREEIAPRFCDELLQIMSMLRTNAFQTADAPSSARASSHTHPSLCPTLAVLNHSCRPNVRLCKNRMYALRDISEGEELCWNYAQASEGERLRPAGGFEFVASGERARQQLLLEQWGFVCRCELCREPPEREGTEAPATLS